MTAGGGVGRSTLTADDVRAALLGSASHLGDPPVPEPGGDGRDYVDRLPRCSRCQRQDTGLLTFDHPRAWESDLSNYDRIAHELDVVRRRTGRRVVLLCDPCIDALGGRTGTRPPRAVEAAPPVQQPLTY